MKKYEEIKIGDVFRYESLKETVISKSDEYKIITTIGSDNIPTTWEENELHILEPIKEEQPKEGLLVNSFDTLVYRLSENSGYGFIFGEQSNYTFSNYWNFSIDNYWKPATQEQEVEFVEMLKKECEKRGLFEDTKLAECGINSNGGAVNKCVYSVAFTPYKAWNKNGKIFELGKFATPLKEETTLESVSKAVKDIGDFIIEQTESGMIILNPINKNE